MPIIVGGPLDYELNFSCDGRLWPRLCENARDFDANGTAHHLGLVPSVKQIAITTDFLDFALSPVLLLC